MVYSNGVGAQILHQFGVEFALCSIDERIVGDQLVCDTYEILAVIVVGSLSTLCAPLMKNCLPVLSKNLLPLVEIVGMAAMLATKLRIKAALAKILETILSDVAEVWTVEGVDGRSRSFKTN